MSFVAEISVYKVKEKLENKEDFLLLDVRTKSEYQRVSLNKAYHIPLSNKKKRASELDPDQEIILYCHHGGRSQHAVEYLLTQGFKNVKNMSGGIDLWALKVDTSLGRY